MAEFSKEWIELEGINSEYDFSIKEVFQRVNDGFKLDIICEGFGITSVCNEGNECYVIIRGDVKSFFEISGIKLIKQNNLYD